MTVDLNFFSSYLLSFSHDPRITVWHMAVVFAIVQLANTTESRAPIFISRKKVMQLAHIKSIVTYHKCISELRRFGYIQYDPSYHPEFGSRVFLLRR
jgi:hypothetical protein